MKYLSVEKDYKTDGFDHSVLKSWLFKRLRQENIAFAVSVNCRMRSRPPGSHHVFKGYIWHLSEGLSHLFYIGKEGRKWGCSLLVKYLPAMHRVQGSFPGM